MGIYGSPDLLNNTISDENMIYCIKDEEMSSVRKKALAAILS